jgi:molybdenum cofactor guanylyltransferase
VYSAAILAGGQASRFSGQDKSALIVGGRSIRERQLAALAAVTDDIAIVTAERDIVPGCGPLGGIYTALNDARGDAVFVTACDVPFLDAGLIRHLLARTVDADVVVPRTEEGYHPLCAAYTRACLEAIARRLAERRLKISDLFADVRTHEVNAAEIARFGDPARLLLNVNSPADYARVEALQGHEL